MDNTTKIIKKPNPVENNNIFSTATFSYMIPIFKRAFKEDLTEDDLFKPLTEHKSSHIGSKLEEIWKEEYRIHKKTALHRALIRLFGWPFLIYGILKLLEEIMFLVVTPLCIGKLVSYLESGQTRISHNEAYLYACIFLLYLCIEVFVAHPVFMGIGHLCMKLKVSCSSLLYRKIIRLSSSSLGNTTIGQLVNLLSNDVSKFDQGFVCAHFIFIAPVTVLIGTWLLYREIGISSIFGIAVLILFVPLQMWLAKKISDVRKRTALRTDERVRLTNEVISGIQVIKMYCWEKPFAELVRLARKIEMSAIRQHSLLIGVLYSLESFVSRTSVFISILAYVILGNYITAEKIFTVTAVYSCLRSIVTILFSVSLTSIAEVNISIRRMQKVLAFEEKEDFSSDDKQNFQKNILEGRRLLANGTTNGIEKTAKDLHIKDCYNLPAIKLENIQATWRADSICYTLNNINLNLQNQKLLAIIGPVGSGKSSLLNLFLKELSVKSGKMEVVGTISYSSQEPWLFSGSVRQNILFGNEYDAGRYNDVVEMCALKSDFLQFPYGDKTLVGEKGKSLSGGQKARINLARCIYKKADIYLLDDPLSAVDAKIGQHLYEICIRGFLRNKLCVLVTHQLQYLKNADQLLIIKQGQIQVQGTYKELQNSGMDFAKLLEEFSSEEPEQKPTEIRSRQISVTEEQNEEDVNDQMLEKEKLQIGNVTGNTYWSYLKAGGGKFSIFLMIFLYIFHQFAGNSGDYFLTFWVNLEQDYAERLTNNLTIEGESLPRTEFIYWYTAITLGVIISALTRSIYFMMFFVKSSRNLHNYIFTKMIKATMNFFNSNPSGRILNRFSKDIGAIDEYLPSVIGDVVDVSLILAGTIALTAIVNPWLLIPSVVLIIILYLMRAVYIKTSRNLKRLEAITKSPILTHVTSTVYGLSTIRAFTAQKILIHEFDGIQDNHSSAWYLYLASSRCFGLWLDMICMVFIAIALFFMLLFSDEFHGGDLGLVLTQLIGFLGTLQWGMRQWSEMENQMVSVERVIEYTKLETDPNREKKAFRADWPNRGCIQFKDLKLKYKQNDPYVLKGVNISIAAQEKIGIVGRTGAGKSSMISALFQLYNLEGSIIIDDVDITEMPLDEVRSKVSIIPQEPVLFSGTMRKNLDPFEEFSDEVLWEALEQVEMKKVIAELPAGLNSAVSEGGNNFSVGQRQLICLARALIRNNKILVLDEATANVDPHTDSLIQSTIRQKFVNCTVLTIAHRLQTVMDSDKIIVMEGGEVVEFDHPYNLLQKEDGFLWKLIKTTGSTSAKQLENIAKLTVPKRPSAMTSTKN